MEALEKSSENANKENSLLRAQIERLQTELHEYRKRMNESKTNFSNVLGKGSNGGFQFEFPMFGGVNKPTSSRLQAEKNNEVKRAPSNGSASGIKTGPGTLLERPTPTHGSSTNSTPNARLLNGTPNAINPSRASNSPPSTQRSVSTVYSGLFTPSTVGTARDTPAEFTMKRANEITISNDRYTPGQGKHDPSSSPSASSVSHHGTSSSYMTSPESSSYSPAVYKSQDNLESVSEEIQEIQVVSSDHDEPDFYCGVLDDGETSFCEKLGAIACGNPRNPMPLPPDSKLLPNLNEIIPRPDPASVADRRNSIAANSTPFAFDAGFDQVPFKEYRDPMDPSNADMDMSFFNDAFPMADFALGSPIIPASPAPEVVDNVTTDPKKQAVFGLEDPDEADYSSEDEALMITGKADSGLMSCNKIWYVKISLLRTILSLCYIPLLFL